MSKLLKSKFLLGVLAVFVAVFFAASSASAADGSVTMTLRKGMNNIQVKYLQQTLNEKGFTVATTGAGSMGSETSYFGPATDGAVRSFQSASGLTVDGIFGPMSRAALGTSTGGTTGGDVTLCPNGMTLASNCTQAPSTSTPTEALCPNGMTLASNCTMAPGGSTSTGPVTASLAFTTPASGTLVAGQATADLAHFAFSGNGTVTGVTLQRLGVSADSTPSNVYLFDGVTRLTDSASVSSNGMVSFSVPAGLFTVNGSKTLSVRSDIASGTSGQTLGFALTSFTTSSGTSTVNLSGNIHTIASATLATVSAGTVTPSGATLNPGANVTVWSSTLTVAQRDVWMKRLALRNVGSASASAFQNFKLYVNGVQIGSAAGLDVNGYVTFDLSASPALLVAGSRLVRVDADIVSGASRTVHFSLRQAADVDFVDSSFGVNIAPTSTPWTATTASTISGTSGGSLTIEKDVSSPSTNVVNAGTDAVLGTFKFTAFGEAIKVETLRASYAASDGDIGSLRNGRIVIDGVQYGSTATLNEDSQGTPYTSYTVNYTFMPGVPVLVEIRADIFDNDGTDSITAGTDSLTAKFAAGSSNAIRQDSLGSFNAPATAVSANALTVASTTVTLSENTTYGDQSVSLPATNFKIGAWQLSGSSVEDVLLSTLSFDVDEVTVDVDDFNEDDITNMYVVVKNASGTIVAQPAPIATVSAADNNYSINYTLAKNTNAFVELYANLGSTVTVGEKFKTDLTVTGTALTSGTAVTATAADTDGQTITSGAATITATVDASSPIAAIVSDNQTVTSGAFRFAAVTAGYNVTDLTVTIPAAGATSVQGVQLWDGSTQVGVTQPGGATVTFNGLSWNVPANTSKVLTVKLVLGSVGVGAGTSGASLLTTLTVFTATNTSSGVADASANDAGPSIENNPAAAVRYVYASVPTMAKVDISTALTNGEQNLMRFSVTSNGGDIEWSRLFFEVTKTSDPAVTDVRLFDVTGGASVEVAGTDTLATVGAGQTAGTIEFDATSVQSVSGTKTYELRATLATVDVDVDYITTKLAGDAVYAAPTTAAAVEAADADATIIWSDISAGSHGTGTSDWSGEYGVLGLPISHTISS